MKIDSVSVAGHLVFGTCKINLFKDSEALTTLFDKSFDYKIDLTILESDENTYTFIIGDNGSGKTALLKTVVSLLNWHYSERDEKIRQLISIYPADSSYRWIFAYNNSQSKLSEYGLYNEEHESGSVIKDILKENQAQLIYISASMDGPFINKNPKYRNYNNSTSISNTKGLFLNALRLFHNSNKIELLDELLKRPKNSWKLKCSLSVLSLEPGQFQYSNRILADVEVELSNQMGFDIVDFLKMLESIKIVKHNEGYSLKGDSTHYQVFDKVYDNIFFLKAFYDLSDDEDIVNFWEKLQKNVVLTKINEFIKYKTEIEVPNRFFPLRGKNKKLKFKQEHVDENFLDIDPKTLSKFEVSIIQLLENLGLINYTILSDELPLERMSSGEQNMIRIFSYFADLPLLDSWENLIVFFDEPETSLHPKWQFEFPIMFNKIAEEVYHIKKSHFVFATHSPLIIMKSKSISNSNIISFTRENDTFNSYVVPEIETFNVEPVLLNDFKFSYRNPEKEQRIENIILGTKDDPINTIESSIDLKKKINDLYNSLKDGLH